MEAREMKGIGGAVGGTLSSESWDLGEHIRLGTSFCEGDLFKGEDIAKKWKKHLY